MFLNDYIFFNFLTSIFLIFKNRSKKVFAINHINFFVSLQSNF